MPGDGGQETSREDVTGELRATEGCAGRLSVGATDLLWQSLMMTDLSSDLVRVLRHLLRGPLLVVQVNRIISEWSPHCEVFLK